MIPYLNSQYGAPFINLRLPLPPSVNQLYGRTRGRGGDRFKTAKGRDYERAALHAMRGVMPWYDRLGVVGVPRPRLASHIRLVSCYLFTFGDSRRRDVANYEKALTDCLVKGEVIPDDSCIDLLVIERGEPSRAGAGVDCYFWLKDFDIEAVRRQ